MAENSAKFWKFILGVFGVVAAVSSFLTWMVQSVEYKHWPINKDAIIYGLVLLSCAIMLVAFLWGLRKHHTFNTTGYVNATHQLSVCFNEIAVPPAEWSYHAIANENELKEIWKVSQTLYGEDNVPFEIVVSWWKCYPNGIFVLYKYDVIAGYFSMWPIKKTTYDDIVHGRKKERELKLQSIMGKKSADKRPYWYVTNVVICKQFRKTIAIKILMREALRNWVNEGNLAKDLYLCAFAYSNEGEEIIKRSGFTLIKPAEDTADRKPLYTLSPSRANIDALISRLQNEEERTQSALGIRWNRLTGNLRG
ncbi:hypothetical protein [Mucilaginibacter gilvus]|uniref:Uncharacterized protein n=1 Tax=Mucilaginibacter gilvus TaxID=2305909 RepID=A0A3S4YHT7_9SPHI|nr:hypothetical protein [Mucilaginibacter gilvus]RWY55454.1 hypothetical protein EPL05_03515 [Mucilaginibacter gilvus]